MEQLTRQRAELCVALQCLGGTLRGHPVGGPRTLQGTNSLPETGLGVQRSSAGERTCSEGKIVTGPL